MGTGTMIMGRHPFLDCDYARFSLNGNVHQILLGDALAGAGVGLARTELPEGLKVNLCVSHYHAEYNRYGSENFPIWKIRFLLLRENDEFLADRAYQALEAVNFIDASSDGADIVIYAGDFNTESGDLPHRCEIRVIVSAVRYRLSL